MNTNTAALAVAKSAFNNIKLLLILGLFLFFITANAFSAEKGMDVALVLDTSGSMKKNDPNQLRIQAAKLFVNLLSRKDRVSLVGFSNRAYAITPLLPLNSRKNETKLLKAIDRMSTNGRYSNLHDALEGGYDLLKSQKSEDRTRHIILMSDGKMDLGNKERNLKLLEKTLEKLTPKLSKEDIKVHTIAFTRDSYIPLLKLAAEDTGGQFILLKDANGIHQVFENIFERTKSPETLPVEDGSFVVDKNVKEVTIVASKFKHDTLITIQSPDGEEITLDNYKKNVNWYQARKFDLVTIKNPLPGYWRIKYSEGGNKAYIVSDITLESSSTKSHAEPGAPLHIQAQLKRKNRRIRNKSLLSTTKFRVKVTSPTGAEIENELNDDGSEIGSERQDGIYGISYAFEKQGPYKIEVTAKGETFDRKKTLFIDVKSTTLITPFQLQQDVIGTPDILDSVEQNAATVENTSQAANNQTIPANAHATQGAASNNANTPADMDNPDMHMEENVDQHGAQGKGHIENNGHDSKVSDEELAADDGFGVKDAIIAFLLFNVIIALFGGAYYYWYKKKQTEKGKDKTDDEEDKNDAKTEAASELEIAQSGIDLEPEDGLSTSISDIELEEELSSILENEKDDK